MPYVDKAEQLAASRRSYRKVVQDPEAKERKRRQSNEGMKAWYRRPGNAEKVAAYQERWREENKEWANIASRIAKYGLTLDQFHARYEAQNFCCAICGEYTEFGNLVIDHCHGTTFARGLLCWCCNSGIGQLRESTELMGRAVAYIKHWAAKHESDPESASRRRVKSPRAA